MTIPDYAKAKGTFLSIAGKIDHLHIVCTDNFFYPGTGSDSVVVVNISSVKENCPFDDACVLDKGDHPFIKHRSYVRYKDATVYKVDNLRARVATGEVRILTSVSSTVFNKVLAGFENSDFTNRKMLKLIKQHYPLPIV